MNTLQSRKALFALFIIAPFALNADAMHSGINIVTISGQDVMMKSETGQKIQVKMNNEQEKHAKNLKTEEEAIKKAEKALMAEQETLQKDFTDFDKNAKMMSSETREKKQKELEEKAIKFDDNKRKFERDVAKLNAEGQKVQAKLSEIYQKEMTKLDAFVKSTIKEVAENNKWDLVLMEESIMYASPKMSKTNMIIEKLDAKTKAMNLAKKEALEKKSSDENKN
jgi:Skp family chaperone for outer membrane proteins